MLSIAIPICLGVLLAQALNSERGFRWLFAILGRKWSAPAALAALAICLYPARTPVLTASLATVALVGACVVREDNGLAPILTFRPIRYIGVLSYGMYLTQFAVHSCGLTGARSHWIHSPAFRFPLESWASQWRLASLSYRYFETPFLELKKRFSHAGSASTGQSRVGWPGPIWRFTRDQWTRFIDSLCQSTASVVATRCYPDCRRSSAGATLRSRLFGYARHCPISNSKGAQIPS